MVLAPDFQERPLWWDAAEWKAPPAGRSPSEPPAVPVRVPARVPVLAIGAGYAGLHCALELARAGAQVLVVDAVHPGYGGSSRNGGQVTGGWNMIDLAAPDAGAMRARVESGLESLRHFERAVADLGLGAAWQPVGKFVAAFARADYDRLRRKAEWASAQGLLQAEAVPRTEMGGELGSGFYHGGVAFRPGGLMQPARYLAALLRAAETAGVRIAAPVRVERLARCPGGWTVETSAGRIEAEQVVVATNGYTGGATPDLQRRVVPVNSYIAATEPLEPDLARSLIPQGRAVSDTARVLSYFRLSPDGRRMVYGGRVRFTPVPPRAAARGLHAMMRRRVPQLAEARISHAWTGNVAFARDRLPHMGEAEGLHWALCCNGSGVAMMGYLGHKIARRILDRPNAPLCAFDEGRSADGRIGAFPVVPLYRGYPWFLPLFQSSYRLRDVIARISGT